MTKNISSRKVIGIGETILDIIFKNNQIVNAVPGGSTFNSIISLGRCHANTVLISEVGNDQAGDYILAFMNDNGVDVNYMLRVNEMQTPVSLAFLNNKNEASYSFYRNENITLPDITLPDIDEDDVVLFGSYYAVDNHGRNRVKEFLEYAKKQGAIIYYDVNYRSAHKDELVKLMPAIIENLEIADIVKGSKDDFDIIYKMTDAERLYRTELSFHTQNLVCTDGENPVSVFGKGNFRKEYPTEKIRTVSTIGAGDNFNAGLIYALLENGVTRASLQEGLPAEQWDKILTTAQLFASNCCCSIFNYVTDEFASKQ